MHGGGKGHAVRGRGPGQEEALGRRDRTELGSGVELWHEGGEKEPVTMETSS